jgi:hypothetical protein
VTGAKWAERSAGVNLNQIFEHSKHLAVERGRGAGGAFRLMLCCGEQTLPCRALGLHPPAQLFQAYLPELCSLTPTHAAVGQGGLSSLRIEPAKVVETRTAARGGARVVAVPSAVVLSAPICLHSTPKGQ